MKPEKHIPTIFGLLLLLASIFGGVILTSQKSGFSSKASGSCEPINPQITNVTDNSAIISFSTNNDCLSSININNQIISADSSKKIHYFEVSSLKENSDYVFSIISGGKTFESSNFQVSTAKKPSTQPTASNLAWGKVVTSDGKDASNVLVYLNIPGAYPLSALTTSSGNWNIPLSASFNEAKNDWFKPMSNIEEEIFVIAPDKDITQVTNNTSLNNPVPNIIIGQSILTGPEVKTEESAGILPLTGGEISNSNKKLDISNPSEDETISTKKPEFFGTASDKTKITIEVHSSEVINGETLSDSDGTWKWSVPKDLSPGEHTITISAENKETGVIETITRKFIVLAAENDTNFTASSSATTNTPTPTLSPTSTTTSISTPTATKAVTKIEKPSTSSGVPRTGAVIPTIILIASSFLILLVSFVIARQK